MCAAGPGLFLAYNVALYVTSKIKCSKNWQCICIHFLYPFQSGLVGTHAHAHVQCSYTYIVICSMA